MKTTFNPRFMALLLVIAGAASTRFITVAGHTPLINLTPIGAMALFGGTYFSNKWKAVLLPLLTLIISDLVINTVFYHGKYGTMYQGWYLVYAVFVLMVFFGKWIINKVNVKNILFATVVASISHWLITDFGVWLGGIDVTTGMPFTKDIFGLLKCYALAIPYLQTIFLATAFYSAIMFGAFELAQRKFPVLAIQN